MHRYAIPVALPEALLEGFEWDLVGRRYEDLDELKAYAARVAGSVGAMMALLMGVRSPDALTHACELGVAMQLTNIARDVGADARMGRLYLPRRWLREERIDADRWLAAPRFSPSLGRVVARLLAEADALYARAEAGVAALPPACRPGIRAASRLYARIGREVERRGLDSVGARAVVPAAHKLACLAGAVLVPARAGTASPSCEPVRFLVEQAGLAAATGAAAPLPWWDLRGRVEWLLDLFDRLERLERFDVVGADSRPPLG
jgi:phytoene synthase